MVRIGVAVAVKLTRAGKVAMGILSQRLTASIAGDYAARTIADLNTSTGTTAIPRATPTAELWLVYLAPVRAAFLDLCCHLTHRLGSFGSVDRCADLHIVDRPPIRPNSSHSRR